MPELHIITGQESISMLADTHGFHPSTLWNHPDNRALHDDPHRQTTSLQPGDAVAIPDLRLKTVACATDLRHRFVRLGVPGRFRLRLQADTEPIALAAYTFTVDDGATVHGSTDAQGWLEETVPLSARQGLLVLTEPVRRYRIQFGALDPASDVHGAVQRLNNLGYACTPKDHVDAMSAFQHAHGLPVTGQLNDDTAIRLRELHTIGLPSRKDPA